MPDDVSPSWGHEVLPVEFRKNMDDLMLYAVMKSQRAREYALEWMVASIVLLLIYVLTVAIPRGKFSVVDILVVIAAGFGSLVMVRFEWRRSEACKMLVQDLLRESERLHGKSK